LAEDLLGMNGGLHVAQSKKASKRRRRVTTLPVLGVAGMSLSLAGGASAATATTGPLDGHRAVDALTNPNLLLGEEEISDVSLSTFYVFDKENAVNHGLGVQLARGGCGHGCGCGHGGCGGGRCGGCRGGCRCGGGCGWGGCGGCGCGYGCCISWGRCRWLC
jgi:hypothetical protein